MREVMTEGEEGEAQGRRPGGDERGVMVQLKGGREGEEGRMEEEEREV